MKILYLSSVSYGWMKQRPQFICEKLSKKYDVCYTSFTPMGKKRERIKNRFPELKIKDLLVLPFALCNPLIRFLNKCYINFVLGIIKYDQVIVTHPLFVCYLPQNCRVIYECMDNMTAFYEGRTKEFVKKCEERLCGRSDKFITSSDKLKDKLVFEYNVANERITVINNAVDTDWVNQTDENIKLKKPNMVYVGTVDKWFDFEAVSFYCKNHPDTSVYIVGNVRSDIDCSKFPQNMIFTGKVEHEKVFSYVSSADIVILPFKTNELIECVDPVKMYEYLSLNKTVISSYWQELEKFENVHFYKTKEEFLNLAETLPVKETKVVSQFIEENCWKKRIEMYEKVLTNQ